MKIAYNDITRRDWYSDIEDVKVVAPLVEIAPSIIT
jgi:hypothetical protein